MLKKLAAALLLVGLLLPYSCHVRPITALWHADDFLELLTLSLPVLVTVAFVLHCLVPPLARFHERNAPLLDPLLLGLFVVVAGAYTYSVIADKGSSAPLLAGVVAGVALLAWSWRRPKPARLPLVMLASIGVAVVGDFASLVGSGDLEVGAWILTAGYVLAVFAALAESRPAGAAGP